METSVSKNIELYKYDHIYKLLIENFNFDEEKYGDYIKDIIKVLKEFERVGETSVDIDNRSFSFDLLRDDWPDMHINALKESGLLNNPNSPLVINKRKISLIKWEKRIRKILNIFQNKIKAKNILCPLKKSNYNDKVNSIVDLFNKSDLVFIQGGPGTGKSTLIVNLIKYYLNSKNLINIGIGAPTGKSSARLKESLEDNNEIITKTNSDIIECQTLHRWIYNSTNRKGSLKFKLKELDLFIIDEMSMVNIDLIESILDLLAIDCKILLVGDANQLPPINNCSIWNHIFSDIKNNIFKPYTINLTKVYRNNGDIEELSKSIFTNGKNQFNRKLQSISVDDNKSNVKVFKTSNYKKIPEYLIDEIKNYKNALKKATSDLSKKDYIFNTYTNNLLETEEKLTLEIFKCLNSHLTLCKKNTGTWSVHEINKEMINQNEPYDFLTLEEGLPIMCTENNNELGISNGDIGVLIGNKENRRFLFRKFNNNNELVIALINPEKLERIIPALAITIHKAQGSECKKVSILWDKSNNISLNKSDNENNKNKQLLLEDNFEKRLLYTAITRAKESLRIYL